MRTYAVGFNWLLLLEMHLTIGGNLPIQSGELGPGPQLPECGITRR
jgi:hypothetical protein